MLSILDRYILSSFLKKLLNILAVFVIIFLIVDIIENIDKVLDNSISFKEMSMIYFYSIPQYISYSFPMAILISTVLTFTLLQKNNELTAIKSAGVSIYRLSIPFFVLGIIFSCFTFYFDNLVVNLTNSKKVELENELFSIGQKRKSEKDIVMHLSEQKIVSIEKYDRRRNIASNISIQSFDDNTMIDRTDIDKLVLGKKGEDLSNAYDLISRDLNSKDDDRYIETVDSILSIQLLEDLIDYNLEPEEMSYWELKYFISKLKNTGRDYKKWLVDLHFKPAFAFSNILMILFGISLSIRKPGSNLLAGVGASILVIFIYYILIISGKAIGYNGVINPMLSVWIPNLLFLIIGGILIAKTRT